MMNKTRKTVSILLAALMLAAVLAAPACKRDYGMNPVIMKIGGTEITKFDFDTLYATHDKYAQMAYGAINMRDYFDLVMEDMQRYAVALDRARGRNYELTEADEASVAEDLETQFEHTKSVFMGRVDASITDEEARKAEFESLFIADTGYDSETYRTCLERTLRNRVLMNKLFDELTAEIEPTAEEIENYRILQTNIESQYGFSVFATNYNNFLKGEGSAPLFAPAECFTAVRLLFAYDTVTDGDGNVTAADTAAAEAKAAALDARFEDGVGSAEFLELLGTENDDENMRSERYRSWGYLMHNSTASDYPTELVFAAHLSNGSRMYPGASDVMPEFRVFSTTDGRTVVKVVSDEGISYVMRCRKFIKGNISYSEGDDVWQSMYDGAKAAACKKYYEAQIEEWFKTSSIMIYYDRFKENYMPKSLSSGD